MIVITTHKRPEWCLNLLRQIQEQSPNVQVIVFHDKCDSDYSEVRSFCKTNKYDYFRSTENFGKWKYWQLKNLIYDYVRTLNYKYYVEIPDDVILVDNFYNRVKSILQEVQCFNPFTVNVHFYQRTYFKTLFNIANVPMAKSDWMDCCFAARKSFMDDFSIEEPAQFTCRNQLSGSGVAMMQTKKALELSGTIYQSFYSLLEHIGIKSIMHSADYIKNRKELVKGVNALRCHLHESDKKYVELQIEKYGIKI